MKRKPIPNSNGATLISVASTYQFLYLGIHALYKVSPNSALAEKEVNPVSEVKTKAKSAERWS